MHAVIAGLGQNKHNVQLNGYNVRTFFFGSRILFLEKKILRLIEACQNKKR